jgi:mono/diheme cytochrome c family protein
MRKINWYFGILLLAIIGFTPVKAEVDLERGKKLHDARCLSCHKPDSSTFYTRKNRDIKSYDSLKTRVETCANRLKIPWFPDDEVVDVTAYMNAEFYKFKKEAAKK